MKDYSENVILWFDQRIHKTKIYPVSVVRHKSLYYVCHSCGSRNPEKHILDAASGAA